MQHRAICKHARLGQVLPLFLLHAPVVQRGSTLTHTHTLVWNPPRTLATRDPPSCYPGFLFQQVWGCNTRCNRAARVKSGDESTRGARGT